MARDLCERVNSQLTCNLVNAKRFMSRTAKSFLQYLLIPLSIVFGSLFLGIYKLFFGWWADTEKDYIKRRNRFAGEIQEQIPILFLDHAARIVPDTEVYPRAFDYVAVTVAVDDMLLRFIRGRGDFRVDVAPARLPAAWREIATVVTNSALTTAESKTNYYSLRDFGRFFHSVFPILKHELGLQHWRAPGTWLVPIG